MRKSKNEKKLSSPWKENPKAPGYLPPIDNPDYVEIPPNRFKIGVSDKGKAEAGAKKLAAQIKGPKGSDQGTVAKIARMIDAVAGGKVAKAAALGAKLEKEQAKKGGPKPEVMWDTDKKVKMLGGSDGVYRGKSPKAKRSKV